MSHWCWWAGQAEIFMIGVAWMTILCYRFDDLKKKTHWYWNLVKSILYILKLNCGWRGWCEDVSGPGDGRGHTGDGDHCSTAPGRDHRPMVAPRAGTRAPPLPHSGPPPQRRGSDSFWGFKKLYLKNKGTLVVWQTQSYVKLVQNRCLPSPDSCSPACFIYFLICCCCC